MSEHSTSEHTDSPNQRLCKGCREWIDGRAASCYLCGEEGPKVNVALVNAVHTEKVNANLFATGNRALQERRVAASIPSGNLAGKTGPSRLYNIPGAKDLASHYKSELQNAGFGEK